jgi:hypothetical protein
MKDEKMIEIRERFLRKMTPVFDSSSRLLRGHLIFPKEKLVKMFEDAGIIDLLQNATPEFRKKESKALWSLVLPISDPTIFLVKLFVASDASHREIIPETIEAQDELITTLSEQIQIVVKPFKQPVKAGVSKDLKNELEALIQEIALNNTASKELAGLIQRLMLEKLEPILKKEQFDALENDLMAILRKAGELSKVVNVSKIKEALK